MAASKIRVMISSRCNDSVQLERRSTYSALRKRLKEELEAEKLLGSELFDVWINEDAPSAEGTLDAWDYCLKQVRRADIVLVLYNGNSGWAKPGGGIGICHAELSAAQSSLPRKVRIIRMPSQDTSKDPGKERHERFQQYVESQGRFSAIAKDGLDALQKAKGALREAVAELTQVGARAPQAGAIVTGDSLDWSRLDFEHRSAVIAETIRTALASRPGSSRTGADIILGIGGQSVLTICHAVPAAMSVAAAREMVGQPFLRDHEWTPKLASNIAGPVHFIGCHRSVTEAQAMRQLGFPDATIVSTPFGIYVADNVQRIQLLFLANCRDETSTRYAVQRVFDCLEETEEDRRLGERAKARARIVKAIANEVTTVQGEKKKPRAEVSA